MANQNNSLPKEILGGVYSDNRGVLSFVNDFNLVDVKRFYCIQNEQLEFRRGWNGHRLESKYFYCIKGRFRIGLVKIMDWLNPSKSDLHGIYELSEMRPKILFVPPGFANCVINLTTDSKLLVFSTLSLQDSLNDKIRFPSDLWKF